MQGFFSRKTKAKTKKIENVENIIEKTKNKLRANFDLVKDEIALKWVTRENIYKELGDDVSDILGEEASEEKELIIRKREFAIITKIDIKLQKSDFLSDPSATIKKQLNDILLEELPNNNNHEYRTLLLDSILKDVEALEDKLISYLENDSQPKVEEKSRGVSCCTLM